MAKPVGNLTRYDKWQSTLVQLTTQTFFILAYSLAYSKGPVAQLEVHWTPCDYFHRACDDSTRPVTKGSKRNGARKHGAYGKSSGKGERDQVDHFSQILVVIAYSSMNDINHDHTVLPRCKSCYVTVVR